MKSIFDCNGRVFNSKYKSSVGKSLLGKIPEKPRRFQSKI